MSGPFAIENLNDQRLRPYADLRDNAAELSRSGCFIVEGRWCVERLLESDYDVISVLVQSGKEYQFSRSIEESTPLYSLPPDQIRQLVGFDFHRGVLACGKRHPMSSIEELRFRQGLPRVALAALGVSEHENFGSMIRTATALGIENVILTPKTVDPYYRRSIRVSMATIFQQNLYELQQPDKELEQLRRDRNVRIIVTTLDRSAVPLQTLRMDDRDIVLVVGNEANGVDAAVQRVASDRVTIPMQGTDSLNVSVAAAIFMHDLIGRQRN